MSYFNSGSDYGFIFDAKVGNADVGFRDISSILVSKLQKALNLPTSEDKRIIEKSLKAVFTKDRGYLWQTLNPVTKQATSLLDAAGYSEKFPDIELKKSVFCYMWKFGEIQELADSYAKKENLPQEFKKLALNDNCLKILTGFFLKQHHRVSFDQISFARINKFTDSSLANTDIKTPYERTGDFRCFLYDLSRTQNDKNPQNIPSPLMRLILSTARLYFSWHDEVYLPLRKLEDMYMKSHSAALAEKSVGGNAEIARNLGLLTDGKSFIENWRVRHLFPVFGYLGDNGWTGIEMQNKYVMNMDSSDRYLSLKLVLVSTHLLSENDIESLFEPAH